MSYWTDFANAQIEQIRLQKEVFDLMCSIQILQAEQNAASKNEILALKAVLASQRKEMYKDISHQLVALERLKNENNDCECSC